MLVVTDLNADRNLGITLPKSRSHNSFEAIGIGVSIVGSIVMLVRVDGKGFKSTVAGGDGATGCTFWRRRGQGFKSTAVGGDGATGCTFVGKVLIEG